MPAFVKKIISKVLKPYRHKRQVPTEIMWEVTLKCNLSCRFCFNKLNSFGDNELDTIKAKVLIDAIKDSGVLIMRFTGGEPLLRDDIFELIEYAYKKGLKVWLNTNATLINKNKAEFIAEYVDNILIPLNAFHREGENKITSMDMFKRKLRGILFLKKKGIKYIRCGTIATKENIRDLEKIYALVKSLQVNDWELFRPLPIGAELPINNSDVALLVEKLIKINEADEKNFRIANAIPFCSYEPEKVMRVALGGMADDGHNRFVIGTNGLAKPMYYFLEHIGDAFADNVIEIWNKKFMKDMRALRHIPPVCRKCNYVNSCKGGSRFVSKAVGGDYMAQDYLAQPYRYSNLFLNKN